TWNYVTPRAGGGQIRLALDARIDLDHIKNAPRARVADWLDGMKDVLDVEIDIRGAVFEVRQGYKSKDSKRQNADLANAANAFTQQYLPVVFLLSAQIDSDLVTRYAMEKWVILRGTIADSPTRSA